MMDDEVDREAENLATDCHPDTKLTLLATLPAKRRSGVCGI